VHHSWASLKQFYIGLYSLQVWDSVEADVFFLKKKKKRYNEFELEQNDV